MGTGQKIIVTIGILMIIIVTIAAFFKEPIKYEITTKKIDHLYATTEENEYCLDDNFNYVENYEGTMLTSKKDIENSIYYAINSGTTEIKRYCSKEYTDCYKDIEEVSNNKELLTNLNNFVHPYNSFDNITFEYDKETIKIEINHIYTEEEINKINEIVDNFINNNLTNDLSTREKIKIIHDYIIDNADYDTLKTQNINDDTYKSNTAYGVLVEGYGICSGYSDTMAIFLDKLNVINYKISNDQHIWNLVYIDGRWLHLDLTWDDPISEENITRDNFFLINTKVLQSLDDTAHYYNNEIYTEAN